MIFINEGRNSKKHRLLTLRKVSRIPTENQIQGLAFKKEDMLLPQTIIIQETNYNRTFLLFPIIIYFTSYYPIIFSISLDSRIEFNCCQIHKCLDYCWFFSKLKGG
jgi:hypothetical protein